MHPDSMTNQRRSRAAAVVPATGVVLALTLWPEPLSLTYEGPAFWCLGCGMQPLTDFLLNVALFLPLGLALCSWFGRWGNAVLIGSAVSLVIELLQFIVPGRDPSVRDVIANTIGTAIGALIWIRRAELLRPGPQLALRYGSIAAIGAVLTLGASYALLQPSVPAGTYFGQWAPRFRDRAFFDGQLLTATLQGQRVPQGPESTPGELQRQLAEGSLVLDAQLIPATPSWAFAPIVAIVDDQRREIAALGQLKSDAVFRARTRAASLGLATPAIRIRGALEATDTIVLGGVRSRGTLAVSTLEGGTTRHATMRLSPGLGWMLLLPGERPAGDVAPWLSGLWLLLLILPGAYWLSLTGRIGAVLTYAALVGLVLVALPQMGNGAMAPWWELLGAGTGMLTGWRLARR